MKIPDELQCLFAADIAVTRNAYRITVPKREAELRNLSAGSAYKVAVLAQEQDANADDTEATTRSQSAKSAPEPPVAEGEIRTVEADCATDASPGCSTLQSKIAYYDTFSGLTNRF
jgi:hypothetical protein